MTQPGDPARDLLTPTLLELSSTVKERAARVRASGRPRDPSAGEQSPLAREDEEAVHDFRVAVRRLRTLLRSARWIYGKKKVRAITGELRRFTRATGALREEEVLRETLTALELSPLAQEELARWVSRHARKEQARRAEVADLLQERAGKKRGGGASLEASLARLEKLVRRKRKKERPISVEELARRTLGEAFEAVRAHSSADPADSAAMHALRIRFKRLRYTAELFAEVLGEALDEVAKVAAKMQQKLGDLHDLDEAIAQIESARAIEASARIAVLAALQAARAEQSQRVQRGLGEASRVLLPGLEGEPGTRAPVKAADVGDR